jgi:DNA topoisomerase-3
VLGAHARGAGCLTGNGYVVTWALGHLVGLAEPHEIRPEWRAWRRESLPILPDAWPLVVRAETRDQFEIVRGILTNPAILRIVCATDAGREGELIFRYVYEAAGATRDVQRLWISSLTPDAIREGFARLRPADDYAPLAAAARARSRADWLVGMNLTRAYTLAHGGDLLSVGRVQTPTLAILVERELAIRAFVPEAYTEVVATFRVTPARASDAEAPATYEGTYERPVPRRGASAAEHAANMRRLPAPGTPGGDEADRIVARARTGVAKVESVTGRQRAVPPPQLYDLTELQRHANRLYGMSADRTLRVAQELYETKKLLSYPRTDSRVLSRDVAATLGAVVAAIAAPYRALLAPGTGDRPLGARFVDDARVTDHHAIIPTSTRPDGVALAEDQQRVYDLVCRRLLAAWHEDHLYSSTAVITAIESRAPSRVDAEGSEPSDERPFVDRYRSSGTRVDRVGWRVLDRSGAGGGAADDERGGAQAGRGTASAERAETALLLPGLTEGEPVAVDDARRVEKMTRPPPHLTDAALLTAMETAGRTLDDRELSDAMRARGLGTPATRAAILETLLRRGYVLRQRRTLHATDKGIALIAAVHSEVKSPAMTASWEAELQSIERGAGDAESFMRRIEAYVAGVVARVPSATGAGSASTPGSRDTGDDGRAASRDGMAVAQRRTHGARPRAGAAASKISAPAVSGETSRARRGAPAAPDRAPSVALGEPPSMHGDPPSTGRGARVTSDARARSLESPSPGPSSLEPPPDWDDAAPPLEAYLDGPPLHGVDTASAAFGAPDLSAQDGARGGRSASTARSRTTPGTSAPTPPTWLMRAPRSEAPPRTAIDPATADLRDILRRHLGFEAFRPYQEVVCRQVTAGRDVLLVMPTGAGKSLCYQLPGLARGGTTLVISPLIALMDDQFDKLRARGLRAERIHSGRPRLESRQVCAEYLEGRLDFLFIAPERLSVAGFPELLARHPPSLIAVDEAHCISQWGHDFRPDYRMLGVRLPALRPAPVLALTATATPRVQQDIALQLGMVKEERFIHGFRRTNIGIELVELRPSMRDDAIERLLTPERRPAIVYAPTRKKAESIAARLGRKLRTAAYHAGVDPGGRERIQRAFQHGQLEVVVATIAFGMGIDKADIRTVVHAALPGSIEGYYQEVGRAGRDGKPARAVLLYSYADLRTHEFFLERDYPEESLLERLYQALDPDPKTPAELARKLRIDLDVCEPALEKLWIHGGARVAGGDKATRGAPTWREPYRAQLAHRRAQIQRVAELAGSRDCRMLHLIRHFGDAEDSGEPCGHCDICAPSDSGVLAMRPPGPAERDSLARILAELRRRDGQSTGRLYREQFEGALDRKAYDQLLHALSRAGLVHERGDVFESQSGESIRYRRLYLTDDGWRVDLAALDTIGIVDAPDAPPRKRGRTQPEPARRTATARGAADAGGTRLIEALREWRLGEARKRGVPAFRILTNRALEAIAEHCPETEAELLDVPGVGQAIATRYGKALRELVDRFG